MHSKKYYLTAREKWAPKKVRLIVIAESPPESGNYLYDETGSVRESLFMELMIQLFGVVPKSKEAGIKALQQWGVVMLDATYRPVSGLKASERKLLLLKDLPALTKELKTYRWAKKIPIILIKKNVCELLETPLLEAGFKVVNEGEHVAFPGSGQQGKFRKAFSELLAKHIYAPEKKRVTKALKQRRERK